MEFNLSLFLLALPIAFGLGWMASRLDIRQLRLENRQAPKAYFRGLNFLLNEQQDQAIDAFIEAVQNDPDTSELHFALGNLFRRRGEYERAVRVHEHLLSRGDLSQEDRQRAQHALALDFLKAGLLDRAENALEKLEGTRYEAQARMARLAIYERAHDWVPAAEVAAKLESSGQGSFAIRQAHYLCEQAELLRAKGQGPEALPLLTQAQQTAPTLARPRMAQAQLLAAQARHAEAYSVLKQALHAAPQSTALIAPELARQAMACGLAPEALQLLQQHYRNSPSLDLMDAIANLNTSLGHDATAVRQAYAEHLQREPSLVAAAKWLHDEPLSHSELKPLVQRALEHATKPLNRYRCAACGFEAKTHFWQCPGCQAWDSYPAKRVEEL
ncbi:lipopolysaccharide assembly protein LapB [Curvibacter sp. CHRR-16]|uniref:lipopolysaccharide assembly protein LapB n=1 Tax=Curvibacter sp. CHRR-16 TaxID=2835872 RepID=UPI001BDA277F|nr:lipopolysaccharide assembly protein LapB [Curvibacter sp. CHRR-16]MBT0570774.1 lipopolysaccharide assembly protein LapB [Curvibacter sp. CHRR-16]